MSLFVTTKVGEGNVWRDDWNDDNPKALHIYLLIIIKTIT